MIIDDSKTKFIIGNLVIPVTEDVEKKLKGDYTLPRLKKVFPAVFDRPGRIEWLHGSVRVVDSRGLDEWTNNVRKPSIWRRIFKGEK